MISVVIPTLNNREEFLKAALNSIELQSYLPDEVIIVNNGQGSINLYETNLNIRHFNIPYKSGVAQARNFGAILAKGEYIAFLDDDDLWGEDYLQNMKIKIDGYQPDCLIGKLDQLLNNKIISFKNAHSKIDKNIILYKNPGITGSSVVINKKAFMSVGGYNPKLPPSEDKSLILECIAKGLKIVTVPESQAIIRQSETARLTSSKNMMHEGIFQFYRIYKNQMNLNHKITSLYKIYKYLWMSKKTLNSGFLYILLYLSMVFVRLFSKNY